MQFGSPDALCEFIQPFFAQGKEIVMNRNALLARVVAQDIFNFTHHAVDRMVTHFLCLHTKNTKNAFKRTASRGINRLGPVDHRLLRRPPGLHNAAIWGQDLIQFHQGFTGFCYHPLALVPIDHPFNRLQVIRGQALFFCQFQQFDKGLFPFADHTQVKDWGQGGRQGVDMRASQPDRHLFTEIAANVVSGFDRLAIGLRKGANADNIWFGSDHPVGIDLDPDFYFGKAGLG